MTKKILFASSAPSLSRPFQNIHQHLPAQGNHTGPFLWTPRRCDWISCHKACLAVPKYSLSPDTQYASFLEPDVSPAILVPFHKLLVASPSSNPLFDSLGSCVRTYVYVCLICLWLPTKHIMWLESSLFSFLSFDTISSTFIPLQNSSIHSHTLEYNSKHVFSPLPQSTESLLGLHRQPRRLQRQPPFLQRLQPRVSGTSWSTSRVWLAWSLRP